MRTVLAYPRLVWLLLAEKSPEQLACARAAWAGGARHPVQELYLPRQLVHGKLPLAEQDRFNIFMA